MSTNYTDKQAEAVRFVIDEIMKPRPPKKDHSQLVEELAEIHETVIIKDDANSQWVASVIRAAIAVIRDL
jgi:hypothetical protein